ncbi:MAG: hypothetical protein KDA86_24675 [Planctomycetaceae bacterium]|nr:hypothetical protein [Planctomycetaceae bacterium]
MVLTNWLTLLRNRVAYLRWRRRHSHGRRKQARSLPATVQPLEERILLDGITFDLTGPATVTEDATDGDNNEAIYTISYTGTPAVGEIVSVDVAQLLNETSSADYTSDLATAITAAAAGVNHVDFVGTTLSFENIGNGSVSAYAGTATQGTSGDEPWINLV